MPIEAGFDELGWGMTERQVRARYAKAKVAVPGIVVVMQDKIGGAAKLPITVRFLVRDGLSQIAVMVQRYYSDDATINRDDAVLREWVAKRAGIVATKGEKFTTEHSYIVVAYDDDVLGAWWEPRKPKIEKLPKVARPPRLVYSKTATWSGGPKRKATPAPKAEPPAKAKAKAKPRTAAKPRR